MESGFVLVFVSGKTDEREGGRFMSLSVYTDDIMGRIRSYFLLHYYACCFRAMQWLLPFAFSFLAGRRDSRYGNVSYRTQTHECTSRYGTGIGIYEFLNPHLHAHPHLHYLV